MAEVITALTALRFDREADPYPTVVPVRVVIAADVIPAPVMVAEVIVALRMSALLIDALPNEAVVASRLVTVPDEEVRVVILALVTLRLVIVALEAPDDK